MPWETTLRGWVKWLAAWCVASRLSAGAWADPVTGKSADERGKVVRRDYLFEAATSKRLPGALFVPTGYDAAKPAPFVVRLHGWGSNPWQVIHYEKDVLNGRGAGAQG